LNLKYVEDIDDGLENDPFDEDLNSKNSFMNISNRRKLSKVYMKEQLRLASFNKKMYFFIILLVFIISLCIFISFLKLINEKK
jgi:hypothetical protein